jgi:protein-tyrosine phosphatase
VSPSAGDHSLEVVPMIDLHAHILPALDDGPPSIEAAVEMARIAAASGTGAIATTCHVNHLSGLGPGEIGAGREALAGRLAEEGVDLELLAGGEVAPERLPDLDDETLQGLALGGGPYVLLECPFAPVGGAMDLMVADVHGRGFGVLLAHPERSPTFQREPARLAALIEHGALAQVTTGSFAGDFGETPRRAAMTMLEQGIVHVLASDAHDAVHRHPDLRAVGGAVDDEQLDWMTQAAPAAIVAGRALPERPPLPGGRRWSIRAKRFLRPL